MPASFSETQPRAAPRDLYAAVRIVVVPLHQTDQTAGVSALHEVMATGCVRMARDTPTAREFVRHGVNSMPVPRGSMQALQATLQDLASQAARRQWLGERARVTLENERPTAAHAARFATCLRKTAGAD